MKKKSAIAILGILCFTSLVNAQEVDSPSPLWVFLGADLGIANYSAGSVPTEASMGGSALGLRALIAKYWPKGVLDGGLAWQMISASGDNPNGSKDKVDSRLPYLDVSYRYRFQNGFQLGPELEYWLSTDYGLNKNLLSYESNSGMFIGLQGIYEWQSDRPYRFGGRFLTDLNSDRTVNIIQITFQMGFDWLGGGSLGRGVEDETPARNYEQLTENDVERARVFTPSESLPMKEEEPLSQSEPDPVIVSTPAPVEPEMTPVPSAPAMVVKKDRVIVTLDVNDLPFGFDDSNLPKAHQSRMVNMGKVLSKNPKAWRKVHVSGHTDERGTDAYNKKLSQKRAESVKKLLVKGGAPAKKISAKGFGESRPVDKRHNEKAWARNRRVELEFEGVKDLQVIKKATAR